MKILLSIKPEYAEKILDGTKKFEFRKVIFRNKNVKTIVIYATMPVGKIIGEFSVANILSLEPCELWEYTKEHAGISRVFFDEYFYKKEIGFAIRVKNPKRYKKPKNIYDVISRKIPPQSFYYI